jgi:hypothetical protein
VTASDASKNVQNSGTEISVTSTDIFQNQSLSKKVAVTRIAPNIPMVNTVTNKSTTVSGVTEKAAAVIVKAGTLSYSGIADSHGKFTVKIPTQNSGVELIITAKDAAFFDEFLLLYRECFQSLFIFLYKFVKGRLFNTNFLHGSNSSHFTPAIKSLFMNFMPPIQMETLMLRKNKPCCLHMIESSFNLKKKKIRLFKLSFLKFVSTPYFPFLTVEWLKDTLDSFRL